MQKKKKQAAPAYYILLFLFLFFFVESVNFIASLKRWFVDALLFFVIPFLSSYFLWDFHIWNSAQWKRTHSHFNNFIIPFKIEPFHFYILSKTYNWFLTFTLLLFQRVKRFYFGNKKKKNETPKNPPKSEKKKITLMTCLATAISMIDNI